MVRSPGGATPTHSAWSINNLSLQCDLAAAIRGDKCIRLGSLEGLPPQVNPRAIVQHLLTLKESGATSALITFTDKHGCRELARYDERGDFSTEPSINIQSTAKAVFALFLLKQMGERLWKGAIDQPISDLIQGKLQDNFVTAIDPGFAGTNVAAEWGKLTLRQLLNHVSGLAPQESTVFSEWKDKKTPQPGIFTRYSNTAVEIASAVLQQSMRERASDAHFDVHKAANDFLAREFTPPIDVSKTAPLPPMTFGLYEDKITGLLHVQGSGKMRATVSPLSALPLVVRRLGEVHIRNLFTSIGEHIPGLQSGINRISELKPEWEQKYWGTDLNPEIISNLFYLRPYGYATRGSFENNCDVIIQDFPRNGTPAERAQAIMENPYFTVVRLQTQPPKRSSDGAKTPAAIVPLNDHGAVLQKILKAFFTPTP